MAHAKKDTVESALEEFNKTYDTGYTELKPKQLECLKSLEKKDTVAILPTGYGKSLIFELLPYYTKHVLLKKSVVVLIAPLNSIIKQELDKLRKDAIQVKKNEVISEDFIYYIGHPEDILSNVEAVNRRVDLVYIVVDEAHCILEWGEDFRPQYLNIASLRPNFEAIRMLAITATASRSSQTSIAKNLGMKTYSLINTIPVLNKNVTLNIMPRLPSTGGQYTVIEAYNYVFKPLLMELFSKQQTFPLTVVYCKLRWCAYGVELARQLLGPVFTRDLERPNETARVVQFHSTQPQEVNETIIKILADEESPIRLVFSTIALGMGCDLRHVKRIVHAGPPPTLEAYVQEVGRAGRDGSKATAVMYFNGSDLAQRHVETPIKDLCRSSKCRRAFLSEYFSAEYYLTTDCCDICSETSVSGTSCKDKTPSLEVRQLVINVIYMYINADVSGQCKNTLNEHMIHLIADTFEFIPSADALKSQYHLPAGIAEAVFSITKNAFIS